MVNKSYFTKSSITLVSCLVVNAWENSAYCEQPKESLWTILCNLRKMLFCNTDFQDIICNVLIKKISYKTLKISKKITVTTQFLECVMSLFENSICTKNYITEGRE